MMTSYTNATLQINRDRLRQEEARTSRDRAMRPVRIIDMLIAQLEDLHLEGKKRVPETFDPTLARLNDALPEDLRQELKSRITITHLMDRLYDIQDQLFARLVSREEFEDDAPITVGTHRSDLREAS